MNLRSLRYFLQIVESGSFSKAADRLHVAQPALSRQIRQMEEELGVALLYRNANGVVATEAGERLLHHARRIMAECAEIPESVRGTAMTPCGDVRFGMPGTVSELLAAPLIEAARERYPKVRIRVVEAMSGYILDWLRRGDVDLAMLYATSDPSGLVVHCGLSEEIFLFAAKGMETGLAGDVASLSEVVQLPLVIPGPGHGLRDLLDGAALTEGLPLASTIEIDSYNQIKKVVMRGLGFGILPLTAINREVQEGIFRMWRLCRPSITRKVYLAYSAERPLLGATRAIGQLSWEILRELVREHSWIAELSDESQRPKLIL